MRTAIPRWTTVAVLLAALGGAAPPSNQQGAQTATVRVVNDHRLDVRIYALRSSNNTRLGTVRAFDTAEFRLAPRFVVGAGDLYLIARPIGGLRNHRTQPLLVRPGDVVEYHVRSPTSQSSARVISN